MPHDAAVPRDEDADADGRGPDRARRAVDAGPPPSLLRQVPDEEGSGAPAGQPAGPQRRMVLQRRPSAGDQPRAHGLVADLIADRPAQQHPAVGRVLEQRQEPDAVLPVRRQHQFGELKQRVRAGKQRGPGHDKHRVRRHDLGQHAGAQRGKRAEQHAGRRTGQPGGQAGQSLVAVGNGRGDAGSSAAGPVHCLTRAGRIPRPSSSAPPSNWPASLRPRGQRGRIARGGLGRSRAGERRDREKNLGRPIAS